MAFHFPKLKRLRMSQGPESFTIPVRLRDDDRTATWNPALTRSAHVTLVVHLGDGTVERRRSMNSGRARVREGERIASVLAEEA